MKFHQREDIFRVKSLNGIKSTIEKKEITNMDTLKQKKSEPQLIAK